MAAQHRATIVLSPWWCQKKQIPSSSSSRSHPLFCRPCPPLRAKRQKAINHQRRCGNCQRRLRYQRRTRDLNGLHRLLFHVFAIVIAPVLLPQRRAGGGAMTARRPAQGTQTWLQDGLTVTTQHTHDSNTRAWTPYRGGHRVTWAAHMERPALSGA